MNRLYEPIMHVFTRVALGIILLMYAFGLVGIVVTLPSLSTGLDFVGMVGVAVFPWFATILLHTRKVYGSTQGLEYKSRGRRITVPWSKVELAEYAWWSSSPFTTTRIARVATLRVPGKTKPIWFFANDAILADLHRQRDAGILAERTSHQDEPAKGRA